MAIKGELLKEYTENQLRNCGKVGMYRFGEVLYLTPEQAHEIVEKNEILYINKHEMHKYRINRMIYRRSEIRKEKDALPYCGRFEYFNGDEFITIQEIHKETVKCKLIGPKSIIQKIKDNRELNTVHENMTDDEFAAANADILNEVKFIKGYFNKPRDEVDIHGLHVSKIEDYDNYSYAIYASEKYVYEIYNKEDKERKELNQKIRTIEYLKRKINKYQEDLQHIQLSKIKRVMRKKPGFVEEIGLYDWNDTDRLIRDMKSIARRYKIGLKRAWKIWKFIMVPLIEHEIHTLEDEIGEYSINNIKINTIIPSSREIDLGEGLKYNWLTGVVK